MISKDLEEIRLAINYADFADKRLTSEDVILELVIIKDHIDNIILKLNKEQWK